MAKLESLAIRNFLGCGPDGVQINLENRNHVTIIGKNNTGKSNIAGALQFLKQSLKSDQKLLAGTSSRSNSKGQIIQTYSLDWSHAPLATADVFHSNYQTCEFDLVFLVNIKSDLIKSTIKALNLYPGTTHVNIGFGLEFRDRQKRLKYIDIGNYRLFDNNSANTLFFTKDANGHFELTENNSLSAEEFFAIPEKLLSETLYFPANRRLQSGGNITSEDDLASGAIITWVQNALNPDFRISDSKQQFQILNKFCDDFAKFIGEKSIRLVVSTDSSLQVDLDGALIPIHRLGSGIGECLLILLASLIAKTTKKDISTIILEEPEIHLHARLQRDLVDLLRKDENYLIITTHSPTVINEMMKAKSAVYRTSLNTSREVCVNRIVTDAHLLHSLEDIGATPADVLNADKVLWVEGPNDVPVFYEWIRKSPSYADQKISIVPIGGDNTNSPNYDFAQLKTLNPNSLVILDSERSSEEEPPIGARINALKKCKAANLPLHLTKLRNTESYFTPAAVKKTYPEKPCADTFNAFEPLGKQHSNFSKEKGFLVASNMEWSQLKDTDLGKILELFLKGENLIKECFEM